MLLCSIDNCTEQIEQNCVISIVNYVDFYAIQYIMLNIILDTRIEFHLIKNIITIIHAQSSYTRSTHDYSIHKYIEHVVRQEI